MAFGALDRLLGLLSWLTGRRKLHLSSQGGEEDRKLEPALQQRYACELETTWCALMELGSGQATGSGPLGIADGAGCGVCAAV